MEAAIVDAIKSLKSRHENNKEEINHLLNRIKELKQEQEDISKAITLAEKGDNCGIAVFFPLRFIMSDKEKTACHERFRSTKTKSTLKTGTSKVIVEVRKKRVKTSK